MKITYMKSGVMIPNVGMAEEGKTITVSKEIGEDLIRQGIAEKHGGRPPVVKTMVEKKEAKGGKD